MITGGPLGKNTYKFEQFHCHWGCSDFQGSEHTVNGFSYSGELHLVHWNATKYKKFIDASSASDGLAVFGIFLKTGSKHDEISKITELLHLVVHKGDRITLPYMCDPGKLLPYNKSYWTYEGSLTTSPYSESVIWIIFKTPIEVSQEQLKAMRNLNSFEFKEEFPYDDSNGKVKYNFRPPLPLGSREVKYIEVD